MSMSDPGLGAAVAEYACGTCKSERSIAEAFGLDVDTVLQLLDDNDVECCETCGWWADSSEFDENRNCGDCRE